MGRKKMNKGERRTFIAIMSVLMLMSLVAGAYFFVQQHDYTYEEAKVLYKHYDAETTYYHVDVNLTKKLDNATGLNAWMVRVDCSFNEGGLYEIDIYGVLDN